MSLVSFEHPGFVMGILAVFFGAGGGIILFFNRRRKRRWVKYGFVSVWFLTGMLVMAIPAVQYAHVFWDVDFPDAKTVRIRRLSPLKPVELPRTQVEVVMVDPTGSVITDVEAAVSRRLVLRTSSGTFYKSLPSLKEDRVRMIKEKLQAYDPDKKSE
jgi:hypothetical protein